MWNMLRMPTLTLSDLYFIPSLISPPQHACLRYTDVSDASNFALTSAQNIQFRVWGGEARECSTFSEVKIGSRHLRNGLYQTDRLKFRNVQ